MIEQALKRDEELYNYTYKEEKIFFTETMIKPQSLYLATILHIDFVKFHKIEIVCLFNRTKFSKSIDKRNK